MKVRTGCVTDTIPDKWIAEANEAIKDDHRVDTVVFYPEDWKSSCSSPDRFGTRYYLSVRDTAVDTEGHCYFSVYDRRKLKGTPFNWAALAISTRNQEPLFRG